MEAAFEMAAGETVQLASLVAECQKWLAMIHPSSKAFCCGAQPFLLLDMASQTL